jgi:long-subunit acyl-CoA synthetase (AMP-forming)
MLASMIDSVEAADLSDLRHVAVGGGELCAWVAGMRRGTAGHPVPGVSVRIVDPSTGSPVAQGVEGLLLVSGPNLMKGYVEGAELTHEVLHDRWYVTGDRASVDGDGFLTIARRRTPAPAA